MAADLSDLEKGARESVQDSCPTYSERLRDLNGNISLPPNPEWPSENVRLAVQSTFSNGFRKVFAHLQHPSLQFLFPRLFIWDWRSAAFIHLPKGLSVFCQSEAKSGLPIKTFLNVETKMK